MIELYYSPGACSLVAHVALNRTRLPAARHRIRIAAGEHRAPAFLALNPEGRVPALRVDGTVVTESLAVVACLDSLAPEAGVLPVGAVRRAVAVQWLSHFASTVHIGFAQIWRPERFLDGEDGREALEAGGRTKLAAHFRRIDEAVADGWLAGDAPCAADVYPLVFRRWALRLGFEVGRWSHWARHAARLLERPEVREALRTEGLSADEFERTPHGAPPMDRTPSGPTLALADARDAARGPSISTGEGAP